MLRCRQRWVCILGDILKACAALRAFERVSPCKNESSLSLKESDDILPSAGECERRESHVTFFTTKPSLHLGGREKSEEIARGRNTFHLKNYELPINGGFVATPDS